MKSLKILIVFAVLFFVSCSTPPAENPSDKPDNAVTTEPDTADEPVKPVEKNDKTEKIPPKNDETTKPEPDKAEPNDETPDDLKPLYDYKMVESENSKHLAFQTEHAYVDVNFSDKNSILDFYKPELAELGKKHLIKKCIDYIEVYYSRIEKWLELGKVKPAYPGVYLYLHESSTKIDIPKDKINDYLLLVMNLSEFSRENISQKLWYELVPINSDIVKTGLSIIQPSYKGLKLEDYYKYVPVMRMCVSKNDFFNNTSSMQSKMYDLQRADFVTYMLENAGSTEKFLESCNDEAQFKKFYTDWMQNRKQFFENDTYPEFYDILYLWYKGQNEDALRKTSTMMINDLKPEQADFLDFINLTFFASRYDFIRKYLEERVLSIDFLFNRMPKENSAILFDQIRIPIELLVVGIFQEDTKFNQKLVVYLDKLGFVLMSKFLLNAESLLSDIELLRKSGRTNFEQFLTQVPKSYVNKFSWWYQFLLMISDLKYGLVTDARTHLDELSKLSNNTSEVELARFAFEQYSK